MSKVIQIHSTPRRRSAGNTPARHRAPRAPRVAPSPAANTTPLPAANTAPSPAANTAPSPAANTAPSPAANTASANFSAAHGPSGGLYGSRLNFTNIINAVSSAGRKLSPVTDGGTHPTFASTTAEVEDDNDISFEDDDGDDDDDEEYEEEENSYNDEN